MFQRKSLKIDGKLVEAMLFTLFSKNLIVVKGSRGYIMCGYLNLRTAEKFKDAAVKVTGVATIGDLLKAKVHSATSSARRLGIHKGQPVREALKMIA